MHSASDAVSATTAMTGPLQTVSIVVPLKGARAVVNCIRGFKAHKRKAMLSLRIVTTLNIIDKGLGIVKERWAVFKYRDAS